MKKYIGFMMLLFWISCTTEEVLEQEITTVSTILLQEKVSIDTATSAQRTLEDDIGIFRSQMEWAAFITAEVLADSNTMVGENSNVMTEMNSAISTYGTAIPIKALLGRQSNYPNFRVAFKEQFLAYYIGDCKPNFGVQRPPNTALVSNNPPPPTSDESLPNYIAWAESFTTSYIDQITNANCIELYIPNGIAYGNPPNGPFPIGFGESPDIQNYIVGAHPLTNEVSEGPGWIILPGKPKITLCSSYMAAHSTVLSPMNTTFDNVIMARPYRDPNAGCNYVSINVSDFTLYLQ